MSIDARIVGVRIANGETVLTLEPRDKYACVGQNQLVINNPPSDMESLEKMIGMEIWGSATTIMHGNDTWAIRRGYEHIELVKEATQ